MAFRDIAPKTRESQQDKVLIGLRKSVMQRSRCHRVAAQFYERRYYLLVLPQVVLSAFMSFLVTLLEVDIITDVSYKIMVSIGSLVVTLLSSILALLKYQTKMECHKHAERLHSAQYQSLLFNSFAQAVADMSPEEFLKKLAQQKQILSEASNACPYTFPDCVENAEATVSDKDRDELSKLATKVSTFFHGRSGDED
eukprot:TRINITY_DN18251_c2_g1_i1.p1 TRINITY_DN18251_c2_g1~~TRINITY_DN18251_c2_g1_i1.p1  ORF type:complete len:224 (-),score=24.02 TRINITY_DN18251_c2_g1_i1:308-898(-)